MMRRLLPKLMLIVAIGLATLGGAAAAEVLVEPSEPVELVSVPGRLQPVPGSDRLAARAADPAAGPRWAVRSYRNRGGEVCADFGREVDGRIGLISVGEFRERRLSEGSGNCGDPAAASGLLAAATVYPDDPTTAEAEPARTIVHGIASARVADVVVEWDGESQKIALSPDGAFIAVADGERKRIRLTVRYRDGSEAEFVLDLLAR